MTHKTIILAAFLATSAAATHDERRGITIEGKLNCPYSSHNGGTAYLQISVTTPRMESSRRRPMNLAVVLDRSGSMADQKKMDFAKKALSSLVDQLDEEDVLSIVIYDDVIEVLRSAQRVRDKQAIKRLLERVSPRGSTNLGGGTVEGFKQVERNLDKEYVNRVVLLSDGLANQGITDPQELNRIARRYRGKSISLTTMGVGLDYNENLMMGLSESGGGNYYFIESPHSLASIMRKEFDLLSSVVAQHATIELSLGNGVRVLDVIGCEHRKENNGYLIPIGDLYTGDHRDFTVELEIPEGTGSFVVVRGVLRFDGESGWSKRFPSFTASVHYTRDLAVIEKNRDLETQAKADVALSTRIVERALEALDKGDHAAAEADLKAAEMTISASPASAQAGAAGVAIREQRARLESYRQIISDSLNDARKAKKAIQYDNYRTQKNR